MTTRPSPGKNRRGLSVERSQGVPGWRLLRNRTGEESEAVYDTDENKRNTFLQL